MVLLIQMDQIILSERQMTNNVMMEIYKMEIVVHQTVEKNIVVMGIVIVIEKMIISIHWLIMNNVISVQIMVYWVDFVLVPVHYQQMNVSSVMKPVMVV